MSGATDAPRRRRRIVIGALLFLSLGAPLWFHASAQDAAPGTDEDHPRPLAVGETAAGTVAAPTSFCWFRLDVPADGAYLLTFDRDVSDDAAIYSVQVKTSAEDIRYSYEMNLGMRCGDRAWVMPGEFQFFPVLEKKPYILRVAVDGREAPSPFHVTIAPWPGKLTEEDKAKARAAIDKGVALLLQQKPDPSMGEDSPSVASEAFALGALCEGKGAKERGAMLEADYVGHFESILKRRPTGSWKGEPVFAFSDDLYAHAITTLAVAEYAAASGSARAKALLPKAATFLLATQLTPQRCAEWVPIEADNMHAYGWRYGANANDADISVTGWCVTALAATSVAGVEVEGMRDAVWKASEFVGKCKGDRGFGYMSGGGTESDIEDAIGALVSLLVGLGDDSASPLATLAAVGQHLAACTQTDRGKLFPLYYDYYATRDKYLYGGKPWELWRSTMVHQLLRNQTPDGDWILFGEERGLPQKYSTALGVTILRICLGEVPAYLKREVKGF
jgi:hypothetical protein